MAVSKRLRYEIFRRDNHACRYCGAMAPDAKLTIDHVTPTALGGTDTPDNLVTACADCNSGKTSVPADAAVVADVAQDQVRWAAAMKQAAAELEAQDEVKLQYRAAFEDAWNSWTYGPDKKTIELPDGWRSSVERYRVAGIPATAWPDIIEPGMANKLVSPANTFRYTCGVANKRIEELHAAARRIAGFAPEPAGSADNGLTPMETAICDLWAAIWEDSLAESPTAEQRSVFSSSLVDLRGDELDPPHLIEAAQHGAWFDQGEDLRKSLKSLRDEEISNVVLHWAIAWNNSAGEYPDNELSAVITKQCTKLIDANVSLNRIRTAALIAGMHLSTSLHFGLTDDEQKTTGVRGVRELTIDMWARVFAYSAGSWPTEEERSAFSANLARIGDDGGYWIHDVYQAAVAAGTYQDVDLTSSLTRHLSVFKAASHPIAAAPVTPAVTRDSACDSPVTSQTAPLN